jgi:nucleoside-diphosphate-sugar epimerase
MVMEYGSRHSVPFVLIRPGVVYGPGNEGTTPRVGLGTFGLFLHLGGSNQIPFTYVENCADAIVLAGLTPAIDGETFNIVDDELPTSRQFLRFYKKQVRRFGSVYLPKFAGYTLCALVEKYSYWSQGQLPPFLNRRMWHAVWKRTRYTNEKAKRLLKWNPAVRTGNGLERYFHACRETKSHA